MPEKASEPVSLTATAKGGTVFAHVPFSPAAPVWTGVLNRSEVPPVKSCNEFAQPEARLQQLLQLQQQMFQSVASTIKQGFALLTPELSKVWNLIRYFEKNIEKSASDESERLSFLLQYCTGVARNAIKSCFSMDPTFGYQTAWALLQNCFGHPLKIAVAHLNQITHGPPVKPSATSEDYWHSQIS